MTKRRNCLLNPIPFTAQRRLTVSPPLRSQGHHPSSFDSVEGGEDSGEDAVEATDLLLADLLLGETVS